VTAVTIKAVKVEDLKLTAPMLTRVVVVLTVGATEQKAAYLNQERR
jgi:hypothetical protein